MSMPHRSSMDIRSHWNGSTCVKGESHYRSLSLSIELLCGYLDNAPRMGLAARASHCRSSAADMAPPCRASCTTMGAEPCSGHRA